MGSQYLNGLDVDSSGIFWTTLKRRKRRWDVVAQKHKEVVYADAFSLQAEELAGPLKKVLHGLEGPVCMELPVSSVLLRITELPSIDPEELAGMVELQVDKFSPFPIEQMLYSYEVLQQDEQETRVVIAAVRRELVDETGQVFRKAGVILYRLDVRLMVWWTLLKEQGDVAEHGQQSLLVVERGEVALIVAHHGVPVLFRTIGTDMQLTDSAVVEEIVEEYAFTVTTLEAEWGSVEEMKTVVWSDVDIPSGFSDGMEQVCHAGLGLRRLDELPSVTEGLARRAAEGKWTRLNLAPEEWAGDEKYRRLLRRLGGLTVMLLICWAMALGGVMYYLKQQQTTFSELTAGQDQLEEAASVVRTLRGKVRSLEAYSDRSRSALECLREITVVLPMGVDLTSYVYKKGSEVNMKGEAARAEPIYDFMGALEQSEMFTAVQADGIVSKRRGGQIRSEFSVVLTLPGDNEE